MTVPIGSRNAAMLDVHFLSFRPMMGYGTTEIRCRQPVAFLGQAGFRARAAQLLEAPTRVCSLLVLHRVRHDTLTERIVALARRRGTKVIYDIDDFIADAPEDGCLAPPIRRAMRLADVVTVSGSFLRDRVAAFHPDCRVLRNKLSQSVLDRGRAAIAAGPAGGQTVTLGYFSGSAHHDADFAMITPALLRLLRTFPQVRIMVGGKIGIDPAFRAFADRVVIEPFRPYADFVALLAEIDINLAPLDLSSNLARARSELKYIEAAAFGVPSVASPSPAFCEALETDRTGWLCPDDAWFDMLAGLVSDETLCRRVGAAARTHVENAYGPHAGQAEWEALVGSLLGDGPTPSARLTDLPCVLAVRGHAWTRKHRPAARELLGWARLRSGGSRS